jgi:1,4-alpha-glucan branching enzyme
MYAHPGAKMLFMGGEFAQRHEWDHDRSLDWSDNNHPMHQGIQLLLKDLNTCYKNEPALFEKNFSHEGFEWIDFHDAQNSVIAWMRKGFDVDDTLVIVANFTPVHRENYRIGAPRAGIYEEIFNSDALVYGGAGVPTHKEAEAFPIPKHGRAHSLSLILPPLGLIILKRRKVT